MNKARNRRRSRESRSSSSETSSTASTLVSRDSFDDIISDRPKSRFSSRTQKNKSNSSNSSCEENQNRSKSPPMKIYVAQKPPIDRLNLSKKRSPSLEKPSRLSSDCEITDVSPLTSPIQTRNSSLKTTVHFKQQTRDHDVLDMSLLMKVLNDDTKKCLDLTRSLNKTEFKKSFDYSEKREERRKRRGSGRKRQQEVPHANATRLSSAALNRLKEQQRIEKENRLILKRLLAVKPTKYLDRTEQLRNYDKSSGSFVKPANRTPSALADDLDEKYLLLNKLSKFTSSNECFTPLSRNMSALSSSKLTSATSSHSRISSAKSNASSMKALTNLLGKSVKPAWNDRW